MLAIGLFRQDSEGNKKGIPELGLMYPDLVEPSGLEPLSKRGSKPLSTCLV